MKGQGLHVGYGCCFPPNLTKYTLNAQASELGAAWMLSTYLDETLRISRDDAGRVFVLMKDDPLLASELQL